MSKQAPERTQTLLVELSRPLAELLVARYQHVSSTSPTGELATALRAALSHPEHQERERLEQIATAIESGITPPPQCPDAAFLRNLASQEHRGADRCDCEAWSHPEWKGCPVHGTSGPQPPAGEVETEGIPTELSWCRVCKAATEGSGCKRCLEETGGYSTCRYVPAESATEIARLRGEVERLRELRGWVERQITSVGRCREHDEDDKRRGYLLGCEGGYEYVRTRIDYMLRSAPSDSQGDQERCKRCGGTQQIIEPVPHGDNVRRCPDCNPAPTQVEGDAYAKRCDDELAALPDPPGIPPHLFAGSGSQPEGGDEEDWPPTSLVEALAGRYHGRMPFDERHADEEVESRATSRDAMKLARADLLAIRSFVPATSQDSSDADASADELAGVAVETGRAFKAERDRANKAEAERDEARGVIARVGGINPDEETEPFGAHKGAGPITWNEAGRRLEDIAERSASHLQRAETALEELASDLEAAAYEQDEAAKTAETKAEKRAAINRKVGLLTAADAARERAAELKEGRQ